MHGWINEQMFKVRIPSGTSPAALKSASRCKFPTFQKKPGKRRPDPKAY